MKPIIKSIRSGFTLVELLVVIAIIGILAGMSITIVQGVRETARVSATHARISKLDAAITEMYESYQYRRIDVDISKLDSQYRNPRDVAEIRLKFLCQTMRMEMPMNWDEVMRDPQPVYIRGASSPVMDISSAIPNTPLTPPIPPLLLTYRAARQAAFDHLTDPGNPNKLTDSEADEKITENGSAELLYQIITNGMPEMREMFASQEIGDVDGDGLPEFLDAWGNPICFVRWAAAFPDSDRQPDIVALSGYTYANPNDGKNATHWIEPAEPKDIMREFEAKLNDENFHNQFFSRYADPLDPLQARSERKGWLLVPLIISPGPDGELGIGIGPTAGATGIDYDDPFLNWGMPDNYDGKGIKHLDNIHNHRVQNLQW